MTPQSTDVRDVTFVGTETNHRRHCEVSGQADRVHLKVVMPFNRIDSIQGVGVLLNPHVAFAAWVTLTAALSGCSGDVSGGPADDSVPMTSDGHVNTATNPPGTSSTSISSGEPTTATAAASSDNPTGGTPPAPPSSSVGNPEPVPFAPAQGAYRRLTNAAFANTLRDLLAGPVQIGALEPDSWAVGGLPTIGAAEVSVSELGVEQYHSSVEASVELTFEDPARRTAILGCSPSSINDTVCFDSFVRSFGRRAFRQPLTEAQVARYTKLILDVATTFDDPYEGMQAATTALLLSPNFLYRLERGQAVENSGFWQYTSHEIASRLAYFLTNSTPDETLLELADQDELRTSEAVRAQAERLLDGPAGRESVGNFANELFQLRLVSLRAKDPELFPEYDAELQQAMMQEVPAMFASVVFDRRASALELFTTRNTFVTKELGAVYGLEVETDDEDALVPAILPPERAGLLGTGAILSIYGSQKEGSPTLRGKFVREVLLCQPMPAAPPDVSTVLEDPPVGQTFTKRERLIMHQEQPSCAACHALMDPIGLTLESYDAIGRFRTTDAGKSIDLSGSLDGTAFNGGVELGQLLANRPDTATCMLRNLYRYATGHVETASEATVLETLNQRFTAGDYRLRDLMLDIVVSDGFRYVAPPTP